MQLRNAAEGQECKMSAVHPVWSASSSNASHSRSPVDTYGRLKHWWPSQAYHCTFCTRVFRTAQALGGHMNIHRRERACANDVGTHNHTRSSAILSEPSHLPVPIVEPGRPLFGASHRLLMTPTPPNSIAGTSICYMENCYTNRRLPSQSPVSHFNVSTHLQISANFTPVLGDATNLTDQGAPRPGCNWEYGKHEDAPKSEPHQPVFVNNNISDPLTWLISQLPPPGTALSTIKQSHSACRSNILMQRNLTKPYHRALAVSKSPPGVRRHVCRMSPLAAQHVQYTGMMQSSRGRAVVEHGESSSSGAQQVGGGATGCFEESLDLELRL